MSEDIEATVEAEVLDETVDGEEWTEAAEEEPKKRSERHHVLGEDLLGKVKEIVREGNVRRLLIRNEKGRTLVEIPLSIGVVGAVLLPVWAAVGAIAAVVTKCTIDVERYEEDDDEAEDE